MSNKLVNLISFLQKDIPSKIKTFSKINQSLDPYYFEGWVVKDSKHILIYWFWSKDKKKIHHKKVYLSELEVLFNDLFESSCLSRSSFVTYCPMSFKSGPCGFAVIVSILTFYNLVVRVKPGFYKLA